MPEGLPEEITIGEQELQVDEKGMRYEGIDEKTGLPYGGDYLPKTPDEIDLNFPPAPEEVNPVM